jgi:hypothetical protein
MRPYLENPITKKLGLVEWLKVKGLAQGIGPEFKLLYCKKTKDRKTTTKKHPQ